MSKKNLGKGPYNFKIGDDSWGKELISDITDVTSTVLTDGYFTGIHTISADRAPTTADISATLDGITITFESRKWRWVNTIDNEVYSLKEITGGTVADWEKANDISLSTTDEDDGSVFIAEDGSLIAISATSGFIYVDGSRVDDYIENGSVFMPYKTLKSLIDDGHNNCTVIINEGSYDSGEAYAIPDSMNLVGTAFDNCFIDADVTFTNSTGDGQGIRFLRFTGNVTQVTDSFVTYEKCYFTGVGTTVAIGGYKSAFRDCYFASTLTSVSFDSDEGHLTNVEIDNACTITGDRTLFSDCTIAETVTHELGAGHLIFNNVRLSDATTALVSNAVDNEDTPVVLSGVAHIGVITLSTSHTILNEVYSSVQAEITGTNIKVNILTGENEVPYYPTEDFHPATVQYVQNNIGMSATDANLSEVDRYFAGYPETARVMFSNEDEYSFLLLNSSGDDIFPLTSWVDYTTTLAALVTEGWTVLATVWQETEDYSINDSVIYEGLFYTAPSANLADIWENQTWDIDNTIEQASEFYRLRESYDPGVLLKIGDSLIENQTAGSLIPTVTSGNASEAETEGWTILGGYEASSNNFKILNPAGDWKTSVKDTVYFDDAQGPVDNYLNYLPTIVVDRNPAITDISAEIGNYELKETVDIEYGWKWINDITGVTWECRGRIHNGVSWETVWLEHASGSGELIEDVDVIGVTVGALSDGDTLTSGTSLTDVMKQMLQLPPEYDDPIATLSLSPSSYQEVGSILDFTLTPSFTQNDAGDINNVEFKRDSTLIRVQSDLSAHIDTTQTVVLGTTITYSVEISYDQGPLKNDASGDPYPTGRIDAGTVTGSGSYTGAYRNWYGPFGATTPVDSDDVRTLDYSYSDSLTLESGTTDLFHVIAVPNTKTLSSVIDEDALGADITANYVLSATITQVEDGGATLVDYNVYILELAVAYSTSHTHTITII